MVDTFGTGIVTEEKIVQAVCQLFDMTPKGIIRTLDLRRPIYHSLASYGHMGREDLDVTWERCNRTVELRQACGLNHL